MRSSDDIYKLLLDQVKKIHPGPEEKFIFRLMFVPKTKTFHVCMIRGLGDLTGDAFYLQGEAPTSEEAVVNLLAAFATMIEARKVKLDEELRRVSERHAQMTVLLSQVAADLAM